MSSNGPKLARVALLAALIVFLSCNRMGCPSILYPWIDQPEMLPKLSPIPAVGGLSATRCGQCHRAIYEEWASSLMARSATNAFFVAERARQRDMFLCGRCHHPLENQEPLLVDGLIAIDPLVPDARPNPEYDEALRSEGVTCVVCHMSPEAAFWPEAPYASPLEGDRRATVFNARPIDGVAPHPLAVAPGLRESGRVCVRCHQFDPIGAKTRRPALDTIREYELYLARGGRETCTSCHMPLVRRPAAAGGPVRDGHEHRFPGILDAAFIRRHLRISAVDDPMGVRLEIENLAGHRFPTGEPGRVLRMTVELRNAGGRVAARTVRFLREIDPESLYERLDASLDVGERRVVLVPFSDAERAQAQFLRWDVELARYEPGHPLVALAGPRVGTEPLGTHVSTATVALGPRR